MELVPIGVAADRLGMATSALRYYDERRLVPARSRESGRRLYGPDELRRLAMIKVAQQLGIRLDVVGTIFDGTETAWREAVTEQIEHLDTLIERASGAREFLTHVLGCRAEDPVRGCDTFNEALDHVAHGGTVEELRDRQAWGDREPLDPLPSSRVEPSASSP